MWPIVTGGVVWSIGRSVTIFSSAKVAEPIEVPFGLWTRVGPRNNVLDGGPDFPMHNFEGERGGAL